MKFTLIDVETTGSKPNFDRIIDIGLIMVDNFEIVEEWESLINPGCPINPFITGMTGITDLDVAASPAFEDIHAKLMEMLQGRIFVAHNVRFDYSFIKQEFKRINKTLNVPQLCTVRLSRKLFPGFRHHNLDSIIERFNLKINNRHRALPDAKIMYAFIRQSLELKGVNEVNKAINSLISKAVLPPSIPNETIQDLPGTTGVYIFQDSQGIPLYVGKSVNIKDRVLNHFYNDLISTKEQMIKKHVHSIDTIICAGELEALITESRLIKTLKPLYNHRLKHRQFYWCAIKSVNESGYLQIIKKKLDFININQIDEIVAVSHTKQKLTKLISEKCDTYHLCPQLLDQVKTKSACFSYQLNSCYGACISKEKPKSYNARFSQAFCDTSIRPWPFDYPIVLDEWNQESERHAYHLISRWQLIKTVYEVSDLVDLSLNYHDEFSFDEYQILFNYLNRPSVLAGISKWSPSLAG